MGVTGKGKGLVGIEPETELEGRLVVPQVTEGKVIEFFLESLSEGDEMDFLDGGFTRRGGGEFEERSGGIGGRKGRNFDPKKDGGLGAAVECAFRCDGDESKRGELINAVTVQLEVAEELGDFFGAGREGDLDGFARDHELGTGNDKALKIPLSGGNFRVGPGDLLVFEEGAEEEIMRGFLKVSFGRKLGAER